MLKKMNTDQNAQICDAFILCGGLGSRIKPIISDRPKGLAPVKGKAVLDILVNNLVSQGFQRVVFCVGHLHEKILEHFCHRHDIECIFSIESNPLGTGGAIIQGLMHCQTDNLLVMNGDSFCDVDYKALILSHNRNPNAAATIVVTPSNERDDVGNVLMDEAGLVTSFIEKSQYRENRETYTNAGVYILNRSEIEIYKKESPMSLETNFFPYLVSEGKCFAMKIMGEVIDIGTPERYAYANSIC